MRRKSYLIFTALFPMLLSSCGVISSTFVKAKDNFGVTGVYVTSEKELFLTRGQTSIISADVAVKDESVDKTVTFISSDSNIASVDSKTGLVTAGQTTGECRISVISVVGGYSDFVKVYVTNKQGQTEDVTKLTLSKTSYTFETPTSEAIEIIPTVEPFSFNISTISWTISDSSVAKFEKTATGVSVSPLAKGNTVLTAKAGSKTANCNIIVKDPTQADPEEPTITLKDESKTLHINETFVLVATTTNILSSTPLTFTVKNDGILEVVARQNRSITVKALQSGTTTITVSYDTISVECAVTVDDVVNDYESFCSSFSQPGHVYLHYLRTTDADYEPWAVWMWQKVPEDSEGTLWGATHADELKTKADIASESNHWMTNSEIDSTVTQDQDQPFCDSNGQIVDIDVSRDNLKGGKTGVDTSFKVEGGEYCERVGFLIVDQTKMTGKSHWKSDGGIESYIYDFNTLVGDDKYVHIFCIEGQVSKFTTTEGAEIEVNPTISDTKGLYRSQNDITDLLRDNHPGQPSPTSSSFLDDKPGVGYQIFVPAFADSDGDKMGDLGGIIAKIDEGYFDDLGVGVLWLTPVQKSGSYHGYDVTDYYSIDSKFGTMEQYKELITKAHSRGIKVLMDMVINHTSKNNVLFTESQRAGKIEIAGNQYDARNMYLWKFKGDKIREWDGVEVKYPTVPTYNDIAVENSEDWYQDGSSNYYYYGKFGSGMAELNYSCEATRLYMETMCKWWLTETGLDGFRLDAIKHIYLESELSPSDASKYASDYISTDVSYRDYYDDERQEEVHAKNDYTYDRDLNVKFWKEFAWNIKKDCPNCFLVGENFDGWNDRIAPFYESMDSQFDFATYYHLNERTEDTIFDGAPTNEGIKYSLEAYKAYRSSAINGAFTSNHDISRMMNHAAGALLGNKTHHDEVTSSNYSQVVNQAKYAAAVTLLTPGVSWIYYGDELGMTGNLNDPVDNINDHGNNVDRWYRQPMKWANALQGQEEGGTVKVPAYGFGGIGISWDKINKTLPTAKQQALDSSSMLSYFRQVGKAKSDPRYPTYGQIVWGGSIGGANKTCAFCVSDGINTCNVFINNSNSAAAIPSNDQMAHIVGGSSGATTSSVPAHGFVVLSNKA